MGPWREALWAVIRRSIERWEVYGIRISSSLCLNFRRARGHGRSEDSIGRVSFALQVVEWAFSRRSELPLSSLRSERLWRFERGYMMNWVSRITWIREGCPGS